MYPIANPIINRTIAIIIVVHSVTVVITTVTAAEIGDSVGNSDSIGVGVEVCIGLGFGVENRDVDDERAAVICDLKELKIKEELTILYYVVHNLATAYYVR